MVREVEGEVLLLDTESNCIHRLNATASIVWRRFEHCATPEEIAAELAKEYDVDEGRALSDVVRTLDTLRSLNLVFDR